MKGFWKIYKYRVMIVVLSLPTFILMGFLNVSRAQDQPVPANQRVAVLTFHAVTNTGEVGPVTISETELDKTFKLMREKGYQPISLEQFHGFIDGKIGVPDKAVLVTFDDGYEDNYTLGYPLGKKYNIPAVVFSVAKWFSDFPRPEPHRVHMSVYEAQTMEAEGLWLVGNHSFDAHRKIPGQMGPGSFYTTRVVQPGYTESDAEYEARLWNDINLSTFLMDKLGFSQVDFAFPYGSNNGTVKEILVKSGYKYLYTNEPGLNEPGQDSHHIYRLSAATTAEGNIALLDAYFANVAKQ